MSIRHVARGSWSPFFFSSWKMVHFFAHAAVLLWRSLVLLGGYPAAAEEEAVTAEQNDLKNPTVVYDLLRATSKSGAPDLSEICAFGLGRYHLELLQYWLREDGARLAHLFDVKDIEPLLALKEEFADRALFGADYEKWETTGRKVSCSTVLFSVEGPKFTLERVMENIRRDKASFVFLSYDCMTQTPDDEKSDGAVTMSGQCAFLNTFWVKTKLMWHGRCSHDMCVAANIPVEDIEEPNVVEQECSLFEKPPSLGTAEEFSTKMLSEYAQDWFLQYNFFREKASHYPTLQKASSSKRRQLAVKLAEEGGSSSSAQGEIGDWSSMHELLQDEQGGATAGAEVMTSSSMEVVLDEATANVKNHQKTYVDLGGCLPFDYSNTVFFDRCQAERWSRGLCVEPNPTLTPFLEAYRRCKVVPYCVADRDKPRNVFRYRDGASAFAARCTTLANLLLSADLHDVDFLSVDIEGQEKKVFQDFPFHAFNVKFVVVEVGTGVNWLELDTAFLRGGYIKIGILGRDCVYAKRSALKELKGHLPGFEMLNRLPADARYGLPENWEEFHGQVIRDETRAEEYAQARIRREVVLKRQGFSEQEAFVEAKRMVDLVWAEKRQLPGGYLPDEKPNLPVHELD
ncbi:unnamed protein product [Amoebophrya sp. A120]|nr:unnamed protein product [Amoebophrya sp. A120]|eukprot:GSA120T00003332001.1